MDVLENAVTEKNVLVEAAAFPTDDRVTYKDSTYEIVSKVAYLIGVPKRIFDNEHEAPKIEIYEKLDADKTARIIRHLCIIRTAIERNFKHINERMKFSYLSISSMPEYVPQDSLQQLNADGVSFIKKSSTKLSQHIVEINKLISDRINNCKKLFPLYQMNGDYFTEYSKVSDAGSYIKGSIYEFIGSSEKVVVVVDCENSDPYKLCATLKNLDYQYTQKIASIILFDDVHSASAWRILNSFTHIPVEHMMTERVKQNKSLVDVMLIARTCQEHYKNNVDSFILVSSDSDYWGLISSLPEARFLVMIERENCGSDLKNALVNAGIFYCYIDDFYSGNAEDIKIGALFKEMYHYIDQAVRLNIYEMFTEALRATRIEMSSSEQKQFVDKYLKTMQMSIADNGDVTLEIRRK